jgi:3-methyladenine DNA glycosylase Mpg
MAKACLGPHDRASHAARGRTPRNATLSGPSGHVGIDLIDGTDPARTPSPGPMATPPC